MKAVIRLIERLARWGWPLAAVPPAIVARELGATCERGVLGLALVATIGGAAVQQYRPMLARAALVLLGAATLAPVLHLASDDFGYRYAWLHRAAELSLYLRVANLWGGEEGTLLLIAAFLALAACRLVDWGGWSGSGALLICGAFTFGALIWDPFAPTPTADLRRWRTIVHAPWAHTLPISRQSASLAR